MTKLLHIISSPKGKESITIRLGNAIIERIRAKNSGNLLVNELDLLKTPFPHLTPVHYTAFHTPANHRTTEQVEAAEKSEDAIRQLIETDIVVIGAPMHNFTIPSALKAYLDHIVRAGITFGFSASGSIGLFKNKKAYIAFSSGWNFSDPALKSYDFSSPYLKAILELIGINDIKEFRVEGAPGQQLKEAALIKVITNMAV